MKLTKLGPNMTELSFSDGLRVLVSYETPVAAHVPAAMFLNPDYHGYFKSSRFHSRTTSQHIAQWLRDNGAQDVQAVPPEQIAGLVEGR